ncbi:hypothetical protein [Paraburkholderia caribensis]|uniref:hypothetical protein n=1 Tax=Paraburkholderia caribensis TaxID=75105 RepID=UPI0007206343|nr:hypothetical protein [Paraburkholderia caribensis]ALP62802.1 beta-hexosaminidase [Paraburkholderia caribensis]AUT51965.1 beta-hexosaminidase [Paraburkholderia caribensis]
MPRPKTPAVDDSARRDTIGLHSFVKYDPMAPRPTTPITVGKYVVARRPLLDSIYTLYMLMDGGDVVASWISHPSEGDCATAMSRRRNAAAAKRAADEVIAKAKKRKARVRRGTVAA